MAVPTTASPFAEGALALAATLAFPNARLHAVENVEQDCEARERLHDLRRGAAACRPQAKHIGELARHAEYGQRSE